MCEKDLQGTFFALSQDSKIRYFSLMKLLGYAYVCWSNSMLEFRNQFFTPDTKFEFGGGDEVILKMVRMVRIIE
jgi:hypothetical protein